MDNQQELSGPSPIELAWLSGLLNADGCFSLTIRKREARLKCDMSITLTQCDPCVIEKAQSILGKMAINPGISEYEPAAGGRRTKWNARISKMSQMTQLIAAIEPFMVGEKQAQARLMKAYMDRRIKYADPSMRKWSGGEIEKDLQSLAIAAEFHAVRRLDIPKELAQVLNDYPAREYAQARGSARDVIGVKI